jgi:flagellar FliJ protein
MRRFAWRLQRVLDIKAKQEQVKTQELFALTEKLAQTRGELFAQQRILRDILESIAGENPRDRLGKQEFFLRNSAATDERIRELKKSVEQLERKQKEKVAEVLKLRRFKESLERLKEQAKKRYIESQDKLEQKQLDEMATMGFTRPPRLPPQARPGESRQPADEDDNDVKYVKSTDISVSLQEKQK